MHIFLDTVSLYIERKVPMAWAQHDADCYKKGFHDRCFIQKLWRPFAYHDIIRGCCSTIPLTFSTAEPSKGPKKANNRLRNATQCKATRDRLKFPAI